MGINYRCIDRRNCGKRVTLNQPIDHYAIRPKCPECKKDRLKPVNKSEKARSRRRGCFCKGNGWPHNKGAIIDENYICIHADKEKMVEMEFHQELGVKESNKNLDECPF